MQRRPGGRGRAPAGARWVAVAALVTVVAACSGGSPAPRGVSPSPSAAAITAPADPVAAVEGAYAATVAAGSARVLTVTELTVDGGGVRNSRDARVDFDSFLSSTTTTSVVGREPPVTAQERQIDCVVYGQLFQDPDAPRPTEREATWLRLDQARREAGGTAVRLTRDGHCEPDQELAALRGMGGEASVVGVEQLDGVPVVHLRTRVTSDRVVAGAPHPRRLADALRLDWRDRRVEVWLDAEGRIRRAAWTSNGTVYTKTVSDFGLLVAVEPPPPGDVSDGLDAPPVIGNP